MKIYPKIDYALRPESYWEDEEVLAALLRNVKGTQRRQMITDFWEQGKLPELKEGLLENTLSEELRTQLGKIHPAFMGGEYLPDYEENEVEIVRIELESTTADVISIRAARTPKGIRYRVLDEYNTDFMQPFYESRQPLTLQELVEFIDGSTIKGLPGGLGLGYNALNEDGGLSRVDLRHFTTISSAFYPDLFQHFENVFEEWVEEEESGTDEEWPK